MQAWKSRKAYKDNEKEIDQTKAIFNEPLAQVKRAVDAIQAFIERAYCGKPVKKTEAGVIVNVLEAEAQCEQQQGGDAISQMPINSSEVDE